VLVNALTTEHPLPETIRHQRFPSFDGFRGIAIIMVIVTHAFHFETKLFSGEFGVDIFFVVSGFLITILLLREKYEKGVINLKQFYIRRALRIFPVAYLYLIVVFCLNLIFQMNIPWVSFVSAGLYLRNTHLLPGREWFVGHYWSLSSEEQFYLIFPALLRRGLIRYVTIALIILFIIPFSNYAYAHASLNFVLLNGADLLRNLSGLLMGSLFAIFYFKGILTDFRLVNRGIISSLLFCCASIIHAKMIPFLPAIFSHFLIALLIVANLKRSDDFFFRVINSKWLNYIGVLSYSLYIWQEIFTFQIPWANSFPGADSVFLNLLALCGVGWLSYHFVEKPFLKMKGKHR
jgi:peptidoglycan/LPS O-acetylase OafA/YrhL